MDQTATCLTHPALQNPTTPLHVWYVPTTGVIVRVEAPELVVSRIGSEAGQGGVGQLP